MEDGKAAHDNDDFGQTDESLLTSDISVLQELCPNVKPQQILQSLQENNGSLDQTAHDLLGIPSYTIDGDVEIENDDKSILDISMFQSMPEEIGDPAVALKAFQKENTDVSSPREQFYINRMEGNEEMKRDILGLYKDPRKNLKACPKVRFEGEEGVGTGPVREFFVCALSILREGIGGSGRPVVYFEGEVDHLLPIHNQMLQQMGAFVCIGKIIGHSILHGGPGVFGLSSAAKHFWSYDIDENPPHLVLDDIPDLNLREFIHELEKVDVDGKNIDENLKESLIPYMVEAGVDIEMLHLNRKMVIQGLFWYFIINKRKLELEDIGKGMNAVSLQIFLMKQPSLLEIVFPPNAARNISAAEMMSKVTFELVESNEREVNTRKMFEEYVLEIAKPREDGTQLISDLCCFWTGWDYLPARSEMLLVKFNADPKRPLPTAEACFMTLILPVGHDTYESFKHGMNTAITYGSRGYTFS